MIQTESQLLDAGRCYRHFLKNVPNAVELIKVLTDTTAQTVRGWWALDGSKPNGLNYIRVLYFLAHNGYSVTEYEALDHEAKRFAPILVFGLMKAVDITTEMGFKTKRPNDEVYDYFRPACVFGEARRVKLRAFNDAHAAEFAPVIAEKLAAIQHKNIVEIVKKFQQDPTALPLANEEMEKLHRFVLETLPLARRLVSNGATPEDRQRFRNLFQSNELFEFKDMTTALLSEEARKRVIESLERNKF